MGGDRIMLPRSYLDQPAWWHDSGGWLASLPEAVELQCRRWGLHITGPPLHGSTALVIPVDRAGEPLMLRMAPPGRRAEAEVAALRFWAGRGTVQLIDTDPAPAALLLERAVPGTPASRLPVAESMAVLGAMMRRLAVPPPAAAPPTATIVMERASSLERDWAVLGRPLPAALLADALSAAAELASSTDDLAVNGDLHGDQVLRSAREDWLAVDALLYRGDIEYDLARILWTRLDDLADDGQIRRALAAVVRAAGLDAGRTRAWVLFRAVDYWLWGLQAGLTEDPARCARLSAAVSTLPG